MSDNSRVRIYSLLCEGYTIPKVAKLMGCSETWVRKVAQFYVGKGELKRLNRYNTQFKAFKPNQTPLLSPTQHPHPTMLPASIGGIFAITRQPRNIQYNLGGLAYHNEMPRFKSQWGKHKCQIWLLGGFRGSTPQELLGNAKEDVLTISRKLEADHQTSLTLLRWRAPEWIDIDQARSKEVAEGAGIEPGERVEVAGALHKFSDFSHPHKFQINQAKGGSAEKPTEQAKIHHSVYSGEYEKRFEMLMQLHEKMMEEIIAIRQRMELEAKK